ncbi:MAG: NUDIX hydrolase [Chloroflexi bacterium]|nr:NUDIX hydrolase [Chloroflexota bacterium]
MAACCTRSSRAGRTRARSRSAARRSRRRPARASTASRSRRSARRATWTWAGLSDRLSGDRLAARAGSGWPVSEPLRRDYPNPWQRRSSRPIYENPWIAVREDQVIRPDGNPGIYGVVHFQHWAIGVVPLTDDGDTFLVGQYRYTLDHYSWEIPEGGGEMTETPLEAARRELLEEAGIEAATWTYLGEAHLSNSATDEVGAVFLAEGLTLGQARPDGTEDLQLRRVPFAEAVGMALTGEISDALAVVGLLRADYYLKSGRSWDPIQRSFPGLGR